MINAISRKKTPIQTFLLTLAMIGASFLGGCSPHLASSQKKSNSFTSSEKKAASSFENEESSKTLVVYFSATGTTKAVAQAIAAEQNADLLEIIPEVAYTAADLDYNNDSCRANAEQQDPDARPALSSQTQTENLDVYSTVFLGYPIWWGVPPRIVETFVESQDWNGQTIYPFCTSGGSLFSAGNLPALAPGTTWMEGRRFAGVPNPDEITSWIDSDRTL